jgi:hypothetical protein
MENFISALFFFLGGVAFGFGAWGIQHTVRVAEAYPYDDSFAVAILAGQCFTEGDANGHIYINSNP